MNKKDEKYTLNGVEVDSQGEPIYQPKRASKTQSLLLALGMFGCFTGALFFGTNVLSQTVIKATQPESTVIAVVTKPTEKNSYEVLFSNGEAHIITKENISEAVSGHNSICVDGEYYSDEEQLVILTASYTTKQITEPIKEGDAYLCPPGYMLENGKAVKYVTRKVTYILTPEQYANELQDILSTNGDASNYSAKVVQPRPLDELYLSLNIASGLSYKLN